MYKHTGKEQMKQNNTQQANQRNPNVPVSQNFWHISFSSQWKSVRDITLLKKRQNTKNTLTL